MKLKLSIIFAVFFCLFALVANPTSLHAQGTWTEKTPEPTPLFGSGVASVNGIIYVISGTQAGYAGPNNGIVQTVEAYNPATDTWATKSPMPAPISVARNVAVINNVIYVYGMLPSGYAQSTLYSYDTTTDTWTTISNPIPTARVNATMAAADGKIYILGGCLDNACSQPVPTNEAYDPSTGLWSEEADMPYTERTSDAASVNGIIYLVGGSHGYGCTVNSTVQAYDPTKNTWSTVAPLSAPRDGLATSVINGILYAVGGADCSANNYALTTNEAYDPATNTWSLQAPMPTGRNDFGAAAANGILYAIGGNTATVTTAANEAFTPPGASIVASASLPSDAGGLAVNPQIERLYVSGNYKTYVVDTSQSSYPVLTYVSGGGPDVDLKTNNFWTASGIYNGSTNALISGYSGTYGCPVGTVVDSVNRIGYVIAQCGSNNDPVFAFNADTYSLIGSLGSGGVNGNPFAVDTSTAVLFWNPSSGPKEADFTGSSPAMYSMTYGAVAGVNSQTNIGYALANNSTTVNVVNLSNKTSPSLVTSIGLTGTGYGNIGVNPALNHFYVSEANVTSGTGRVDIFDSNTDKLITTVQLGTDVNPIAIAADAGRSIIYVLGANSSTGAKALYVVRDEAAPKPPVANAGASQTLECTGNFSASATLDGSGSTAPSADTLSYQWTDANGNIVGTQAVITVTASLTPPGPTTTTYTLTVTDTTTGLSDTATTNVTVQDTKPPTLTLSQTSLTVVVPTASATGVSSSTLDLNQYASATDICDPNPIISNSAPATLPLGVTDVSFTATDHCGNASASQTLAVQVVYNFSGYLAPVLGTGQSLFKSGRTIPVQFQLTAADGTIITNAVVTLQVGFVSGTQTGTIDMTDATASGSSDTGNTFRFDPTTNDYIFNLSTTGWQSGTWELLATLNDGTQYPVYISIK